MDGIFVQNRYFSPILISGFDKPTLCTEQICQFLTIVNFDDRSVLTPRLKLSWENSVQVCVSKIEIRIALGWTRWRAFMRQSKIYCLYSCCTTTTSVPTSQEKRVGSLDGATSSQHDAQQFTQYRSHLPRMLNNHRQRVFITGSDAALSRVSVLLAVLSVLEYGYTPSTWYAFRRHGRLSKVCGNVHQQFSSPPALLVTW